MNPSPSPAPGNTKEDLKSIVCSNLHEDLNKRSILVNHFSQFGEIEGITCSKVNKYAIINFSSHAGAKAARERGSIIDKNFTPVEIYLSAKTAAGLGRAGTGVKKARLPSVSDMVSKKRFSKYSLDRRTEAQSRPGAKLASNFLQTNVRAYLNPAAPGPASSAESRTKENVGAEEQTRQAQAPVASTKPRINRYSFILPTVTPSQPRTEPADNDPEQEQRNPQESEAEIKGPVKVPFGPLITKQPFSFKLTEKEKASSGSTGEELAIVKSEPQDTQQQLQLPSTDSDMHELLYKRARTSEERYRILDARDKLLRMKNPKVKVRVEFAVKLVGTCKDMCPEKERYMREYQRQLKDYEYLSAGSDPEVDHRKAVKQYSRSSADQEEPLPHELRPTETLDMTMNYLLHNIVNRSEFPNENLLEWYGFMWDRTRSIRKDITQQQLCDLKAVALMEMCTRFHIHCSTRLCELDRHAFDPKLNDENLMKCLQSLEHMYGDLQVKGVQCPNEPEFRSYQILMNLNEGDILWEIQQKPVSILRSPQVQHALKIHLALSQKNFVAFFRLAKNSSYMTSCILHRYFYQVRSFALRRLIRAHSIPQFQTAMPASRVQKLLGFGPEEGNMLKEFCDAHGILYDAYNQTVMLNRKRLTNPEVPLMHREYFLIESKLNISVAEAIKGEELGENPLMTYNPHSSFDTQGYLLKSDEIFTKLSRKTDRQPVQPLRKSQVHVSPAVSLPAGPVFANTAQTGPSIFAKPTFGFTPSGVFGSGNLTGLAPATSAPFPGFQNAITTTTSFTPLFPGVKPTANAFGAFGPDRTSGQNVFGSSGFGSGGSDSKLLRFVPPSPAATQPPVVDNQEERLIEQLVENYKQPLYNAILNKTVVEELSRICGDALQQAREEARIEGLWLAVEQNISDAACEQIEIRTVNDLVATICSSELSQARNSKLVSEEIGSQLEKEVAQDLIRAVCSEIYRQAKLERENNLKRATRLLSRVRLTIWLQHWQQKASQKKQRRLRLAHKRRSDIENFPPSLSYSLSPATILSSWCMLRASPVRINKTQGASRSLDTIAKCEEIRHSFTSYLEENYPSLLGFILEPLRERVADIASIRQLLHPIELAPVVFNILLITEDEQDKYASWVWSGFLSECQRTADSNTVYRRVGSETTENVFISVQKIVLTEEGPSRQISSNSAGIILFTRSEDFDLRIVQTKIQRPVSIVVFNYSNANQHVIRKCIRSQFLGAGLIHHLNVLDMENDLIGCASAFSESFSSFGYNLPLVTPLQPRLAFPSLVTLAQFVITEVFPKCTKDLFCLASLFEAHEKVLLQTINVIEKSRQIGYPSDWPDTPMDLISDEEQHIKKLLPHKSWRSIPDRGELQILVKILELPFPRNLIQFTHSAMEISPEELGLQLLHYAQSICLEGVSSLELMTMVRSLTKNITERNLLATWKQFIYVCQIYRLACLEKATRNQNLLLPASLPLLLDLNIGYTPSETTACHICFDSRFQEGLDPASRRKRSLTADEASGPLPQTKSPRKRQNSILSDIYAFIHEVKQEKNTLLQN